MNGQLGRHRHHHAEAIRDTAPMPPLQPHLLGRKVHSDRTMTRLTKRLRLTVQSGSVPAPRGIKGKQDVGQHLVRTFRIIHPLIPLGMHACISPPRIASSAASLDFADASPPHSHLTRCAPHADFPSSSRYPPPQIHTLSRTHAHNSHTHHLTRKPPASPNTNPLPPPFQPASAR